MALRKIVEERFEITGRGVDRFYIDKQSPINKVRKAWPFSEGHLDGSGFTFKNSGDGIVVWLSNNKELDALAHELIHAISITCNERGIEYNDVEDEHIAYLMSWLFRSFERAMKT